MDLLKNLNPEQLKAVLHKNGPLLIVAGAGTGKTTVITQRIAYLIEQGLAKSDEVLALTFTEKAAGEMEERVDRLLPMGYFDLWISTFHSFGERILRQHGLEIGLPAGFKLINEFEQWGLIKKNLDKFDLDYYRPLGNPTKFIHALIKHFSRAKDEFISPADYLKYAEELEQNLDAMLSGNKGKRKPKKQAGGNLEQEISEQETKRISELANAYHVYEQLLLDNNYLDFGDLINYAIKLFRQRPAILEKYRKQFKYILVDEFQDTNLSQYELIKMLAQPNNNLTVVGDDDQSIFRFRGASMSNILQFLKDYKEAKKVVLTKNYRSQQDILDLSYDFIKKNDPNRLECQLKTQKLDKKLIAENKGKGEIEIIFGPTVYDEIGQTIDKILKLKNSDKEASWNDFAILVRANDSAKDFMAELEKRNLPYVFGASRGLYAKPLVMDIICYFKLLDNYHESRAMWRVLNIPVFNFTHEEIVGFNNLAHKKAWSLYEVLKNSTISGFEPKLQNKINYLLSLISKHTQACRDNTVSQIFISFMNESGYLKYLTAKDDQKSAEAASLLNQFMKRIQSYESSSDDKSIKQFLEELDLEMEAGEEGALSQDLNAGPEAIKILTVHGAKGLEFKYVFVANLVDKRFPTIERQEQIAIPDALLKEILPEGDVHLEEERRLFYVAMTRAKEGLYFSWAEDYGGKVKKKPSRFLVEIGLDTHCHSREGGNPETSHFQEIKPSWIPGQARDDKRIAPNYFSYSQLAAYSNCPYQYRFAHVLKIPVMGKEQFSFGKTLHSTLQKLFILINEKRGFNQDDLFGSAGVGVNKKVKISLDEIYKLFDESWIDDWYESRDKKIKRKKQGKEILAVFYEKYKDSWPQSMFLEKGFNFKIGEGNEQFTIKGVIDRIDQAGDKIKIVDYKTGQPKKELKFEDKEQLLIYQLAAKELFRKEISSLAFYYLDNNTEVEFLGEEKELAKVKENILSTILKIRQGDFSPRPNELCKWCDFKGICEFRKS